jgi:UDP:flavonoid glycosyltransferase YjiC (YdhE family)
VPEKHSGPTIRTVPEADQMRVLFTPYPSFAHLLPTVPLAWAFQAAGHEVRVAVHSSFVDSVTSLGLTAVSLGAPGSTEARLRDGAEEPRSGEEVLHFADVLGCTDAEREYWICFYQYFMLNIGDYASPDQPEAVDLVEFAGRWRPDLVLWDPTMVAAPVAARAVGAAHARILFSHDVFGWSIDRLAARRAEVRAAGLPENPMADAVRPLAERYSVPVDDELLLGQWTIDPLPPGFGPDTSAEVLRMRYVPYNGGGEMQDWLHQRPSRPRVALSLGESTRRFVSGDWDRLPRILEALGGLDVEVIATVNQQQMQDLEQVPDNVRTVEWVPLTQLMPTCSAIIHHGGVGTFSAALAARVPQLVCDSEESALMYEEEPAGGGEPEWVLPAKGIIATPVSEYVMARGAGDRLNHRALTVEEIGKLVLRAVQDQEFRDGAEAAYRTWLATASPADLVTIFERLVRNAL